MPKYTRVRDLVKEFKHPSNNNCIYAFFDINDLDFDQRKIEDIIKSCVKNRVVCIIPSLSDKIIPSREVLSFLSVFYTHLIDCAEKHGLKVGINLQRLVEKSYFCEGESYDESILAGVLTRMEYFYSSCEHINKVFDMEKTMAITAYDELYDARINLTDKIENGVLDYSLPEGNWTVSHYVCEKSDLEFSRTSTCANRLSKSDYTEYINNILDLLGEKVKDSLGKTVSLIYVPELCFDAPNRRDWDMAINDEFIKEYGVHPSRYYDALYGSIGESTANVKSLLLSVRARLFRHGCIDAIREFAEKHGINHIYSLCEPKIPANTWLFGDALKNASPCAVLDKAYMYGSNSIKLAMPAAENTDGKTVYCDIFRDYYKFNAEIVYNEAINAYAQGINNLILHSPTVKEISKREKKVYKIKNGDLQTSFSKFIRSAQALLSIGKCVSDIAIMYPVNAIQANVNFYQRNEGRFEYPPSQIQNDYMTLMSILSVNCAQDAMYIHPDDLVENCRVEGKKLVFEKTGMECRMLFLPGANISSHTTARKIKEFYDAGGTVVATVLLPKYANEFEYGKGEPQGEYNFLGEYVNRADSSLAEIFKEIYGDEALDPSIIRPYYKNTNENGGVAYFIPPSKTAADGSLHVQPSLIKRIVEETNTPLDVYMTNLPKMMNSNGYNTTFYDFKGLGMHETFPYGGLINNIHKNHNGLDIFFFSNTSSEEYHGYALIKGKMKPRAYNPYNKRRIHPYFRYVNFKGEIYTAIDIHLNSGESQFILGRIKHEKSKDNNGYPNIKYLEYNFLTE